MKINWKTRIKHPVFWIGLIGVVLSPVLAYNGASYSDFTSWNSVVELIVTTIKNPYLVFSVLSAVLGFLGVSTDHTTAGVSDSALAQTYSEPKSEG